LKHNSIDVAAAVPPPLIFSLSENFHLVQKFFPKIQIWGGKLPNLGDSRGKILILGTHNLLLKICSSLLNKKSPANAKGNMRQQCMFEGPLGTNLSSSIPATDVKYDVFTYARQRQRLAWMLPLLKNMSQPKNRQKIHKNPIFMFKVTELGGNRKPVYDFLLVINSNLGPISHCY